MSTTCTICNALCAGHADSSNPLCEDCRRLSFSGNPHDRWPDDDPPALTLTPRQLQQLARLVAAGGAGGARRPTDAPSRQWHV
jgi:hypothetical protein